MSARFVPDHLNVQAEMYQRDGCWYLLVKGPQWVVSEFARQHQTHRLHLHNHGGGMGEFSFLLGLVEPVAPLTRRQHLRRALTRRKR